MASARLYANRVLVIGAEILLRSRWPKTFASFIVGCARLPASRWLPQYSFRFLRPIRRMTMNPVLPVVSLEPHPPRQLCSWPAANELSSTD